MKAIHLSLGVFLMILWLTGILFRVIDLSSILFYPFTTLTEYGVLGASLTLIIYSLFGFKGLRWSSVGVLATSIIFAIIMFEYPGSFIAAVARFLLKVFFILQFGYPILLAYLALYSYSRFRHRIRFKKIYSLTLPLLFISLFMLSYFYAGFMPSLVEGRYNDTPLRDKVYSESGWIKCGEFVIDPIPGKHVLTWEKELSGNSTFACYWKITLPQNSKIMWVLDWRYTASIEVYHPTSAYYMSSDIITMFLQNNTVVKRPFKYFYTRLEPSVTFVHTPYSSNDLMGRIDVFLSFKPVEPLRGGGYARWEIEFDLVPILP